jgi:predicted phage tail protein
VSLIIKVKSNTELDLRWSANRESDLSHYNVYKDSNPKLAAFRLIGTASINSYSRTGLHPSTTYYYRIAGVNKAGIVGIMSDAKSGRTKAIQIPVTTLSTKRPPSRVTGVTVSSTDDNQVTPIRTQNKEPDFNRYNIYNLPSRM